MSGQGEDSTKKVKNENPELDCHRCGHKVKTIRKLWHYICSECRIILQDIGTGPIKIPVDVVEDK